MSSIRYFWKSCIAFCAKPKEVDLIKLISLLQISVSIGLKYMINNSALKKKTESLMIATLFLQKISLTAISFYCHNDTPTCHLTSSSPNQFIPEIVIYLPCSSGLVRHILLFVYFFKECILSLVSFTNATPAFSTLWLLYGSTMYVFSFTHPPPHPAPPYCQTMAHIFQPLAWIVCLVHTYRPDVLCLRYKNEIKTFPV